MAANVPASVPAPRLSPFAFPSDTTFRFVLLIVFIICSSLSCHSTLWGLLHFSEVRAYETAVAEAFRYCSLPTNAPKCLQDAFQAQQPYNHSILIWKLGGLAATLSIAAVIYWITPAWMIRRNGFKPITIPEVMDYLQQLRREVGLSCDPSFLWDPLNRASNAVAFGRLRRYYVGLSGGLVAQFYTDRPAFRSVVLHELAHLRNLDINKTYITVALWQAFLVTPIVPAGASLLWYWESLRWDDVFPIFSIALASTALVTLSRNAVLRVREFYADLRTSVWEGPSGSLARVLETLPASKGQRWPAWLQFHPDGGERFQTLKDAHRLFRLGSWEAFGTGVAAALATSMITDLLINLWIELDPQPANNMFTYGAAVYVGPLLLSLSLAVGAVGIGVWRAEFVALMQGQVSHEAWRLGLALTLGVLVYELLSWVPVPAMLTASDPSLTLSFSPFLAGLLVLCIALVFVSAWLTSRWMAAAASIWLEVALRYRSPRLPLTLGIVIGSVSVTFLAAFVMFVLSYLATFVSHPADLQVPDLTWLYFSFVMMPGLLVLVSTVGLWAFPLAAWFWRKRVAAESTSTWAFLDGSLNPLPLPGPPLRPGLALLIGLVAGLLFCTLAALLLYSKYIMPPEILAEMRKLVLASATSVATFVFLLSALIQAVAAAIAAAWIKRLGGLHGLFSAFTAGLVSALGWVLLSRQNDGVAFLFIAFMSPGMFLALPIALSASALRGWLVPSARADVITH